MGKRKCRTAARRAIIKAAAAAVLLISAGCNDSGDSDQVSSSPPERFVWVCAGTSVWQIATWKDAVIGTLASPGPGRIAAVDEHHGSVWLSSPEELYRVDNNGTQALSLALSDIPELSDADGYTSLPGGR